VTQTRPLPHIRQLDFQPQAPHNAAMASAHRTAVIPEPSEAKLAPVAIHDPLALFRPERRLVSLLPTSAHLAEIIPGSLKPKYERTATGAVLHEEDRLIRRTYLAGRERYDLEVHADQLRGRPTMFCWDFMLALWRLADEGAVASDGTLEHATHRGILRAAGRAATDGDIDALKRSLARWAGVHVYVKAHTGLAGAPTMRSASPLPAGAHPEFLEREGAHWVLEYDIEHETRADGKRRDFIDALRINPIWLEQAQAGHVVWINIDLHTTLTTAAAKRLLQIATLRAARGQWRPGEPWVTTRSELHELVGFARGTPPGRAHASLIDAFGQLQTHGAMTYCTRAVRRGEWEYELQMGEALLHARSYRGITPYDTPATRALLWHLRGMQLSENEARNLLREEPTQTLDMLRYAYWLRHVHDGRSSPAPNAQPVTNWAAFIKSGVHKQWTFPDTYHRWVASIAAGRVSIVVAPTRQLPPPPEISHPTNDAPETFPENIWGQVLAAFATENPVAYATWLRDTWLASATEGALVIGTTNEFATDWILEHYGPRLTEIVAAIAGSVATWHLTYFPASARDTT